jgi:hypothetical protein
MCTSISDIKSNYEDLTKEELNLRKYELSELKKVKAIIDSDKWNEVDFTLSLKNPAEWGISKYNFNDCIDKNIIIALKKLVKIGFERAIEKRENIISQLEQIK